MTKSIVPKEELCTKCGMKGHSAPMCPEKGKIGSEQESLENNKEQELTENELHSTGKIIHALMALRDVAQHLTNSTSNNSFEPITASPNDIEWQEDDYQYESEHQLQERLKERIAINKNAEHQDPLITAKLLVDQKANQVLQSVDQDCHNQHPEESSYASPTPFGMQCTPQGFSND